MSDKIISVILSPKLHTITLSSLDLSDILVSACYLAQQRPKLFSNLKNINFMACLFDEQTVKKLILLSPNLESLEFHIIYFNVDIIVDFVRQNIASRTPIHRDNDDVQIRFLDGLEYALDCQQQQD